MKSNAKVLSMVLMCPVGLMLISASTASAATITYSDNFEGSSINPFWTVSQQFGTVQLSSDVSHSATHSAKFVSSSGGQREVDLAHTFATPVTGDFSVYFYDVAPGSQTLYEDLYLLNSAHPDQNAYIGTQDFDASCYAVYIGGNGPNQPCGSFPQSTTTNVARTVGWHLLDINTGASGTSASIDGTVVYTSLSSYSYDLVKLDISGPSFRPNTVAYFDDFRLNASESSPTPEPGTLLLLFSGLLCARLLNRRRSYSA